MSGYEYLNLTDWPFQSVPSAGSAERWVGREPFRRKLVALLRTVQRVDPSRIVLLWAAYGAGKTHGLRHFQHLAAAQPDVKPLYVVTPKGIRSFLDVYRAIVDAALTSDLVSDLGLVLYRASGFDQPTDLRRALAQIVGLNAPQNRAGVAWLKAERVPMTELRASALTRRLETSADGIETLDEFIRLLRSLLKVKVVMLLDEIQELGELAPRQLDEAVGGLHKVFDRNTAGLTLVFSFTTAAQSTVESIIGQTLFARRSEMLTLPPLSAQESVEFVDGLIRAVSIDPLRAPFPFTTQAITSVVNRAMTNEGMTNEGLTPRELIRMFDGILRDAEMEIEAGDIAEISESEALRRLQD